MLQLFNIRKSYTTGDFTQVALNDVSIAFRDNEFVAILGPSGSGKTTLLNIIGGLDHYDSGNMVIDGISTERYKDRDWDTFRNNRIGFVFQSYNLIPHQTVLANVELALTLSGVSKTERRQRAKEALAKVGLAEHMNKKPSQLSGGQMQRVAIARALINDPEILLADEPTGALDSKTSLQIMDMLTEIANDRLVIMVTHNPELAESYATRIVNLSDGHITSDSDPFNPTEEDMRESQKTIRKTSMSFLTALSLSFKNLMTKKGRTIMTAFAGSIGIIGIAAILALANGVNAYIKNVEEETLSEYPLQIMSSGVDLTSLLVGAAGTDDTDAPSADGSDENANAVDNEANEANDEGESAGTPGGEVGVAQMMTTMFGSVGSNDLAALKEYLDSGESGIEPYVNSIEYSYNVAPQLFSSDVDNLRQVNPDRSLAALGLGSTASTSNLLSMTMSTNVFFKMPQDESLYVDQYDVLAGHWPEDYNEIVLVVSQTGRTSDFMLYTMGLRDPEELDEMVQQFAAEEEVDVPNDITAIPYEDILDVKFKLVNAVDYYTYDADYDVWVDKYDDNSYLKGLIEAGEDVSIVGIVKPKEDANAMMLQPGLNYPASLVTHIAEYAADSQIVKDQLAEPGVNVFTGRAFGEEEPDNEFDMQSLFTINSEALQAAFTIDESALAVDMSNMIDFSSIAGSLPPAPAPDMSQLMSGIDFTSATPAVSALMAQIMQQYADYLQGFYANPDRDPDAKPMTSAEYLDQPLIQGQIAAGVSQIATDQNWEGQVAAALQGYMQTTMETYMTAMATAMQQQVVSAMQNAINQLGASMASAINIDADAFADAFQMNMSENDMVDLMTSMMNTEEASYDGNLATLGYADFNEPSRIDIYPIDFNAKEEVINILDSYNERMNEAGEDEKVITYTDLVGTLMASVTEIVNMISTMLIAFVAISLIVSSIMIGVITYISVLERRKEIGILRAIGASKRNISEVFNAETVIIGFVAGVLGVTITALGCIPANIIVYNTFDVPNIAQLPFTAALILVAISVILTFIAGLVPASSASRKDPVEALRSE